MLMRRSTAKNLSIPTLAQRVEALKEECEDELTRLSELHRPSGVPGPWMRRNWLGKANGSVFEALLIAMKEIGQ
jgi:hypothetical protein